MAEWGEQLLSLLQQPQTDTGILFALVRGLSPLAIEINSQTISKFVYLTEHTNGLKLGDLVIVLKNNHEFYVLGKVIK